MMRVSITKRGYTLPRGWLAILFLSACAFGQVPVSPIVQPHVTFVNASGTACSSCKLYTYAAATTTPLATYTDSTGTSTNPNPIVLDAAGGANIWLSNNAYKFALKTALGSTIWSVDQVKGGSGVCGPSGAIQVANSGVNGFTCDTSITVNTSTHVLTAPAISTNAINVGGTSHVSIAPLGTATSWNFDTTSPATALTSIGASIVNAGTTGQLTYYAAAGNTLSGTSAIPNGITATTQAASDNSTKLATTAYVQTPGGINPTSVQISSGVAMTTNQGNGTALQHSTGAATTNHCVKFDANGNTIDSGAVCYSPTAVDYIWTFTSCANMTGQPSQCLGTTTLPGTMPDATYLVHCDVFTGGEPSDQFVLISTWPLPTTSTAGNLSYRMVQPMQNGTSGGVTMPIVCYAHHV